MNGPDAFTTMAHARMMAQQRTERERVQRRLAARHRVTFDGETDVAPEPPEFAGKLRGLRASLGHSLAMLLRLARLGAGTTPA